MFSYEICEIFEIFEEHLGTASYNVKYVSIIFKQTRPAPMCFLLTPFMPLASIYTPWKHKKTGDFLMFSGGIERDQWHEMG